MATTGTIASADGVYTVNTAISTNPDNARRVIDLDITTQTSQDQIEVRVNGTLVWSGTAA